MGLIRRGFFLLLVVLGISGCYSRVETFDFRVGEESIGVFKRISETTATYKLSRKVSVSDWGSSVFVLSYRSVSPFTLSLLSAPGDVLESRRLPIRGNIGISVSVPIPRGGTIWGFKVSPPSLDVKGVEISYGESGRLFEFTNGGLSLGVCVESLKPTNVDKLFFDSFDVRVGKCKEFSENSRNGWGAPGLMLVLKISNSAKGLVPFTVDFDRDPHTGLNRGRKREVLRFFLELPSREENFFLYPNVFGFSVGIGEKWGIKGTGSGKIRVYSLKFRYWKENSFAAIPADPGTILNYPPVFWRRKSFEIFSWNLFPKMLIMDTANYRIQSKFFKRLAFFIEKKGYVGKIVNEETLVNKHGYNAHDYRAADLARFYNTAYLEKVRLNPYERLLKKILLFNGVLRGSLEGNVSPVAGGIISFSRSSSSYLRRLLLTHESYHGVFFSLPSYREACFDFWKALSPMDKSFWRLFLSWKGYNVKKDKYLLVNEFQAYMFQQRVEYVSGYYKKHIIPMMLNSYTRNGNERELSELKKFVDFMDKNPDYFRKLYLRLERKLFDSTGMEGGSVFILKKVQLNK